MRRSSPALREERVEHPVLVWERPGAKPLEFPLEAHRPITIGRDPDSTVVLESTFVSRAHARLEYRDGKYLVEDLGSANGTKVNGAPVAISVVVPGDTIEIGEERLVFVDRAGARRPAGPARGMSKGIRLAMVGIVTAGAMSVLMIFLMRPDAPTTVKDSPLPAAAAPGAGRLARLALRIDSPAVKQVLEEARAAGVAPVDALYDRGALQFRTGRFREAADLFGAVLARDKGHEQARRMLPRCEEEIERGVTERLARAESFFTQMRYGEAALAWEQVLQLVDDTDPRSGTARAGIERATKARAAR